MTRTLNQLIPTWPITRSIILSVAALLTLVAAPALPVYAQLDIPDTCPARGCPTIQDPQKVIEGDVRDGISSLILAITENFVYIIVALSALFIVYSGFLIITDGGSGKRAAQGKSALFSTIIGLVISILAVTIVAIVSQTANGDILEMINN